MADKYKCIKTNKVYRIIQEAKMKDPYTGEWKNAIIYTDSDAAYCRESSEFFNLFKPVEDE